METPVNFTPSDLHLLQHALSMNRDAESFKVQLTDGQEIELVPAYAKYLIEHLEGV